MQTNKTRPRLLQTIYPENFPRRITDQYRPYITLTYAQSMDGCIAGKAGQQIILSGMESMLMTHWCVICGSFPLARIHAPLLARMRTMHDGILVGSNTLRNDNPQLNSVCSRL